MRDAVTVVPVDKLIIVDKEPLFFEYIADPAIHAIQWYNGKGEKEFTDGTINEKFTEEGYEKHVAPFVVLWEQEKETREQKLLAIQEQMLAQTE